MRLCITRSVVLGMATVLALAACRRATRAADDQAAAAAQLTSPCGLGSTLTVRNQSGAAVEIVEVERNRSSVIAEVPPGTQTVTINPRPGVRYVARRIRDRVWLADESRPERLDRGVQLERRCR